MPFLPCLLSPIHPVWCDTGTYLDGVALVPHHLHPCAWRPTQSQESAGPFKTHTVPPATTTSLLPVELLPSSQSSCAELGALDLPLPSLSSSSSPHERKRSSAQALGTRVSRVLRLPPATVSNGASKWTVVRVSTVASADTDADDEALQQATSQTAPKKDGDMTV
ncbi:hypothetical protein LZ30DRAFT_726669 [Colletotrichum cereale]|nr:hypothetical protein LZ30DRAFT_726669 [Colletotrichum cereale]